MLYTIAHFLRDKLPFLWDIADGINSILFYLRYRRRIKQANTILNTKDEEFSIKPISDCKTENLAEFFSAQPEDSFEYFRPHGFDQKSLKKLQRNRSFLAYAVLDDSKIIGYFFGRSFFWGRTYIGRFVDVNYRGRGIAKMMNRKTMLIANILNLRVFQTISPHNIASMKSAEAENKLRVIKTMANGDLLVENLPK